MTVKSTSVRSREEQINRMTVLLKPFLAAGVEITVGKRNDCDAVRLKMGKKIVIIDTPPINIFDLKDPDYEGEENDP